MPRRWLVVAACAFALAPRDGSAQAAALVSDFDSAGLRRIERMMDDAVAQGRIPSAIAMLARNDEVVWRHVAGAMGPGMPMRDDAIIPLASVGKMFTAVAAMILVERGLIALDDPVHRYLPEFADVRVAEPDAAGATRLVPAATPLTIRHLLTHTGGLRMTGDDFWQAWNANVGQTTTRDMARALARLPLESQPGTRFNYGVTGASYEVVAAIIELVAGQTLEAFMTATIFEPLALHDTHFYLPEDRLGRLPAIYRREGDTLALERPQGVDLPRSTYFNGGGGVASAPADLLRFAQLFLNDGEVDGVRVLSRETVRLMMSDHLGDRAPPGGGLSWGIGAAVPAGATASTPQQYGWVGGNYAILWVDRPARVVAYLAFPLQPPGDPVLLNEFRQLVGPQRSRPITPQRGGRPVVRRWCQPAESQTASITILDVGSVEARTGSGEILVRNVDGSASLRSHSNTIRADSIRGPLTAASVTGLIFIAATTGNAVQAFTVTGSIEFRGNIDHGRYHLETHTGEVVVRLAPSSHATFFIDADPDAVDLRYPGARRLGGIGDTGPYRVAVGNGTAQFTAATSRGAVRIY